MIDISKLEELSAQVEMALQNSEKEKQEIQLKKIFLELMECLGYDETMSSSPGAYVRNEVAFEIVFKKDQYDDNSDFIYLKNISVGSNVSEYKKLSEEACYNTTGIDGKLTYYIIYNGFAFQVYANKPVSVSLYNIVDMGIVDMRNLQNHIKLLNELAVAPQDFDDEIDRDDEGNVEIEIPTETKKTKKELPEININKKLLTKIGLIAGAIIIILLVFKFLFTGNPDDVVADNPKTEQEVKDNPSGTKLNTGDSSTVGYLTIKAVLDLNVSSSEILTADLLSDLPENTVIKFGVFCGDKKDYIYQKTDDSGKAEITYKIPETWGEQKITVGAYLKFDEEGYTQPSDVKTKYGTKGENIQWNPDYSKDMITFSETTHSNALVKALLEEAENEKNRTLLATIEKDFSEIDTRVDSFKNIKHVPKGYDFDSTNVSEKVNIYPMIFYDKESDTSYFYIICGFVGNQFLRFEDVNFSCDGYNWKYGSSTNERKNNIVGNKKAEWIYFNSVDNNALLGDMKLVSSSNESKMILSGSINKTFTITQEEKDIIKQFLYIYQTYYENGKSVPDTEWFSLSGGVISLAYIEAPAYLYQRGYREIDSLNSYMASISQKKLNGETVSAEEQKLLDKMNITYRPVSKTIKSKILDAVVNSKDAQAVYYGDYETDQKYMKIYFKYTDNDVNIENGYIPYVNIYEDFSVLVPIKTITSSTTKYDKTYAKFYISETLYNELMTYFDNKQYEQIN